MKKLTATVYAFFALYLACTAAQAQSLGMHMLEDIHIQDAGQCVSINVSFALPVRYVRHSPQIPGREVVIQVAPIAISASDNTALFSRETLSHPQTDGLPLQSVSYENDGGTYPLLTLTFNRVVWFAVSQGRDFRSIDILVGEPDTGPSCIDKSNATELPR